MKRYVLALVVAAGLAACHKNPQSTAGVGGSSSGDAAHRPPVQPSTGTVVTPSTGTVVQPSTGTVVQPSTGTVIISTGVVTPPTTGPLVSPSSSTYF